jgi:hypothetical protein
MPHYADWLCHKKVFLTGRSTVSAGSSETLTATYKNPHNRNTNKYTDMWDAPLFSFVFASTL